MTTQTKHTPGPLVAIGNPSENDIDGAVEIRSGDETVANAYGAMEVSPKAMAAFIVCACNCYGELIAELEKCLAYMEADSDDDQEREDYTTARTAIAKARGEA